MGEKSGGVGRCESTFRFPEMHTVFECQNRPDVPAKPYRGRIGVAFNRRVGTVFLGWTVWRVYEAVAS